MTHACTIHLAFCVDICCCLPAWYIQDSGKVHMGAVKATGAPDLEVEVQHSTYFTVFAAVNKCFNGALFA